jgi:hypothetical protein
MECISLNDNFEGANRDKATDGQIFNLCERLWTDEILHHSFFHVLLDGYFEMDDYLLIHNIITDYWQELGGDVYLGDLMIAEAIVRNVAADEFPVINSDETRAFIEAHRPHRHDDGSLMHAVPATVDEILDLIMDLKPMIGIKELCDKSQAAYASGDRDKIEACNLKENYYAERFRRKKGYMDNVGYSKAFNLLRDLMAGEYKQQLNSARLRARIEQGLQFWDY